MCNSQVLVRKIFDFEPTKVDGFLKALHKVLQEDTESEDYLKTN